MKKAQTKMGRPPIGGEAMTQIAIRLPQSLLDDVETIVAERYGQTDRTAVIRELLASAMAARKSESQKGRK